MIPATERPVKAGDRLLQFQLGGLQSVETVGAAEDGVVRLRSPKGGKESRKRLVDLYFDPEPPSARQRAAGTSDTKATKAAAADSKHGPSTAA